jgi:hypothetical protein
MRCRTSIAGYDTVHYGSASTSETLCVRCFNGVVAEQMGVDFEQASLEPITLADSQGQPHVFELRQRLCATGQVVEAFEVVGGSAGGYQFAVLGDAEREPLELVAELYSRMRRGLEERSFEEGEWGPHLRHPGPILGRIECDLDSDGRTPLVVVDGRPLTWEQFGRMLLQFEGWNFSLEIVDRIEQV